jgi:glycosyltransferase involved in cell wall biosynthesis
MSKHNELGRIAFLLSSLKFGGGERVALNLANALQVKGYEIDFLLMSYEGEFLHEAESKFNVFDLNCDKTYKLPYKLLIYLIRQRPSVLLSSFWKLNLCSCLARLFYPSLRLLLWEHSPPSKSRNSPRWLYAVSVSVFYRMAHRIITVSSGVYDDVANWSVGLRNKLIVIFNPIVPPSAELILQVGQTYNRQIVWVGRLEEPKNPMLALEAFFQMADSTVNLVFIGDGSLRNQLERRCIDLGLMEQVTFLGFQPRPYDVMAHSDLLVLSSKREGLGNVIIEAMFCGLPIVATDCGAGIHDILLDNKYGTIVPNGDENSLAKAMTKALEIKCNRQYQIAGAVRFLPENIANQFLAVMFDKT